MSFIRRIQRKYTQLILKLISIEDLIEAINNFKINKCKEQVTIGANSKFYEEAEVVNLSDDVSKITIGNNTHIRGSLFAYAYSQGITIGNNCFIGKGTNLWSGNKITIGNNVLISYNVSIIDTNSHEIDMDERSTSYIKMVNTGHSKIKGNIETAPIIINDNVWISYNVAILKGVRIGKGAILAAHSVVTKDVPEFTLVAGNPAKVIKKLN